MYLGVDLAVGKGNWAVWADGDIVEEGEVSVAGWGGLLDRVMGKWTLAAVAMEWTGRLAGQWAKVAHEKGLPPYIIHTNHRAAMVRLAGVSHKDDAVDARVIARFLYLWHDQGRRAAFGVPASLFTLWEQVALAWELRGLVADWDTVKKAGLAARNRVISAQNAGQEDRAAVWAKLAGENDDSAVMKIALEFAKEHFPVEVELLQGIPFVGPVLTVQFIAALCPLDRFVEERDGRDETIGNIRKYLRWSPRREQTGTTINRTRREKAPSHKLVGALYIAGVSISANSGSCALGARYERMKAAGKPGKHSVVRVADGLLRCMVAVVRSGQPYRDSEGRSLKGAKSPKPKVPLHLVTKAEASRLLGLSRERVSQIVKLRELECEEWGGMQYVLLESVESRKAAMDAGSVRGGRKKKGGE